MENRKIPLEQLTEKISGQWSKEEWLDWYKSNQEKETYADFVIREAKKSEITKIKRLVATTHFECEPETATRRVVAKKDGKIIGYQEIESFHIQDVDFLRVMVIHPKYRSQGIGEAIISYIISDGRRYQCNIHSDNTASLGLFRKLGFELGDTVNGLVQAFYGFNGY